MSLKKKYLLHGLLKKNNIYFEKNVIPNIEINNAADLSLAKKNHISFFSNMRYLEFLKTTQASAIFIKKKHLSNAPKNIIKIVSENPEIEFFKILNFFYPESYYSKYLSKPLSLKLLKKKYKKLFFGNNLYLDSNTEIGQNVFVGNNVTIRESSKIGNNVIIGSNVIIENAEIGNNVYICDGTIIGKKGFGFKFINNECLRIPHIGKVIIHDGCEIGANCVIDRGSIKNTVIGSYTFLDNFVHIAHNVEIGSRCIFAAQVGIAGSTKIGNNVVIGGQAGVSGHLTIGDNVKIGGKSGVINDIGINENVMGYPAKPFREFIRKNEN